MGRPLEVAGLLALLGALVACQPSSIIPTTSSGSSGAKSGTSGGKKQGTSSGGRASSSTGSSSSGSASTGSAGLGTSNGAGTSGGVGGTSSGGSSGGSCIDQPPDGGCWSDEPDGGPCVTTADCAAGLTCDYDAGCYSGFCQPPPPALSLTCAATGQACGNDLPQCCSGQCSGGSCLAPTFCGEAASACQTDLDCCYGFYCQAGSCTAQCGQQWSPCQGGNDCCYEDGLDCEYVGSNAVTAVCYPGNFWQPYDGQNPVLCGTPCSGWECQVGAACAVTAAGDPCQQAGEVCDGTYNVCRAPETDSSAYVNWNSPLIVDKCIPGAESCQAIPDSTIQPECVYMAQYDAGFCLQPCATTGDCVNPFDLCVPSGDAGGGYCHYWDTCSDYFDPCNSSDAGDGLCMPEDFGFGLTGFCLQALTDGGGAAGSRCLSQSKGNRQNGSLCDTDDLCNGYGLCQPVCNAGTRGIDAGPGCPPGESCFGWFGYIPYAEEIGTCSASCDFTAGDGGGCPLDRDGLQEKCLPQFLLNYPDAPTGFCIAGATQPVGVGQVCPYSFDGQIGVPIDPCVPGSICLGASVTTTLRTCTQLCNRVGQSSGCPSGQTCKPFIVAVGAPSPTHSGYCE